MGVRRWKRALLVLTLSTLIAVGAGGGVGSASVRRANDMNTDISTAVYVVNRYWTNHWSQFFTGRYSPPGVFGGYQYYIRRSSLVWLRHGT